MVQILMVINLYSAFFYWHIQMRFTSKWSMGEMRPPLAAAISLLVIKWGLTTTPGTTLCDKCVGSFTSHRIVWTAGPSVYSPYPRRLESLTICGCNYKGSTFSSVILRPWGLVRPESNSRPPAWQPYGQPTEPPVRANNSIERKVSTNWSVTPAGGYIYM